MVQREFGLWGILTLVVSFYPLWLPSLYTRPTTGHFANPNLLAVITSEVQETYMLPYYGCVGWHLPVKSLQGTPTCRICVAAICTFLLSTFNFCCSGAYHPAGVAGYKSKWCLHLTILEKFPDLPCYKAALHITCVCIRYVYIHIHSYKYTFWLRNVYHHRSIFPLCPLLPMSFISGCATKALPQGKCLWIPPVIAS